MGRVWGRPVRTLTPACPQDVHSLVLPPPRPRAGRVPRRLARVQLMPTMSTSAPGAGPTPRGGIEAPGADLCTFCAAGPFEAVKTTLQFRWTECNACRLQCLSRPESHRNDERTDTKPTRRQCQSRVTVGSRWQDQPWWHDARTSRSRRVLTTPRGSVLHAGWGVRGDAGTGVVWQQREAPHMLPGHLAAGCCSPLRASCSNPTFVRITLRPS